MNPQEGPYWVQIDNCRADIAFEQSEIAWIKPKLLQENLSPYARQIYAEMLEDAEMLKGRAEMELEEWMHKHYEFVRKTEKEGA